MKEEPLVSVVLPAFNSEAFLAEAIRSILAQTYRELELIVINDGSTDSTEQIIRSFNDPRLVYLKNGKNSGLIASLNRGIEESSGEFIVRMDADDISLSGRIEKQVEFMIGHPEIGVAGTSYFVFGYGKTGKVKAVSAPEVLRTMLLFNSALCHPSVIIRKKVLHENNLLYREEFKHAEDYDLWVELSKFSKLGNLEDYLLKYRRHVQQVSARYAEVQKKNAGKTRKSYLGYLGFSLSAEQHDTHAMIAENAMIRTMDELKKIENLLLELSVQNERSKAIAPADFNYWMQKLWMDSCGHSTLGITAYNYFFSSPLSAFFPLAAKHKSRLFAKCVVRALRK
jgi:glycosyltransferase involved in cell wall biosynthesis